MWVLNAWKSELVSREKACCQFSVAVWPVHQALRHILSETGSPSNGPRFFPLWLWEATAAARLANFRLRKNDLWLVLRSC